MPVECYIVTIYRPEASKTIADTARFIKAAVTHAINSQGANPPFPKGREVKCRKAIEGRDKIDNYRLVQITRKAT